MVKKGFIVGLVLGFVFVLGLVLQQGCDDENYDFSSFPQFNSSPPIIELVEEQPDLLDETECECVHTEEGEDCDHDEDEHDDEDEDEDEEEDHENLD